MAIITHEEFMNKIAILNPQFDVISEYKGYRKPITLRCKKDGYIWTTTPDCILNGKTGCPVCSNNVIVKGINSLADTHPSIAKLLNNYEEAYLYSYGSNKKVEFRCPYCGNISSHTIKDVVRNGYTCKKCGDNISFPNKVMFNLLSQLHIEFENEKKFDWGNQYKYDFYIKEINCIIELHGMQHYERPISKKSKRTLEQEKENDKNKKELALKNGIDNYIVIDCRYSDIEYIKENINKSLLSDLYDLSNINWNNIVYHSEKSFLIKACELWDIGIHSTKYIGILLKKDRTTIHKYLSQGSKIGLCTYDPKTSVKLSKEFRNNIPNIFQDSSGNATAFLLDKNKISQDDLFQKCGIELGIVESEVNEN